jgi:hypothetical protein
LSTNIDAISTFISTYNATFIATIMPAFYTAIASTDDICSSSQKTNLQCNAHYPSKSGLSYSISYTLTDSFTDSKSYCGGGYHLHHCVN